MIEIEGPDGVIYEFPDGTDDATMLQAMQGVYGAPEPQALVEPAERGFGQVLYDNIIGDPDDGVQSWGESLGTWLGRAGETATLGLVGDEVGAAAYGILPGRSYEGELERLRANEEGMSTAGRLTADLTGAVLPALLGVGAASGAATTAQAMGRGALVGAGAGATQGFMEGEGGFQSRAVDAGIGGALGGAVGAAIPAIGAGIRRVTGGASPLQQLRSADVPGDELKASAGALYDRAAATGATASQPDTQRLASTVRQVASDEGLITPTGRIAESYPRVRDAINMVDDFAQGTMDPRQMQSVRRTMQAAASSQDAAERRVGVALLREFDKFTDPLAPEFRTANALYRRAMLGEVGETARELAEIRSGQFSGSGLENALRTEYRGLDRQLARGQLRGLTPDQQAAIRTVSRGTPAQNVARGIGKAAPTGVVSATLGGGMPFLVGNALGGPGVGAALGAGAMTTGAAGRLAATRMGARNAEIAELLLRSASGVMPEAQRTAAQSVAEALLFGGALAAGRQLQED